MIIPVYLAAGLIFWFTAMILRYQKDIDPLYLLHQEWKYDHCARPPDGAYFAWYVVGWALLFLLFCVGLALFLVVGALMSVGWAFEAPDRWAKKVFTPPSPPEPEPVHEVEVASFRDAPIVWLTDEYGEVIGSKRIPVSDPFDSEWY